MKRYLGIVLLSGMLLVRCSSGPSEVAGGTVIPNLIVGSIVQDNAQPAANKVVTLKQIVITPTGDRHTLDTSVLTNNAGQYTFENIPKGKYILSCDDSAHDRYSIISRFEKKTDSTIIPGSMIMRPPVNLTGRILCESTISKNYISVFVPGTKGKVSPDSNGIYHLSRVPRGTYEIAITFCNTISYLPLAVENYSDDTIYIKDVALDLQKINLFNAYSFYDHTFDYACSVLPINYRSDNEPLWYADKDFTQTTYFSVADNTLKPYAPTSTMLFILGSDGMWLSDENLISRLEKEMAFSVFTKKHNLITIADTAGMDIIYISGSILADTLQRHVQLRDVHQPIVSSEDNLFPFLMMTDTIENTHFGDYTSDGFIKIIDPGHYNAAGHSNYVRVLFDAGYVSWGVPPASATIVAVHPNIEQLALVFCYDQNDLMVNGFRAPARRVGNFFTQTNYTVRTLTDAGWDLFSASILWALGEDTR